MTTLLQPPAQDRPAAKTEPYAASAIRTVLTHVRSEPEDLPRLKAAAALARKLEATLFGMGSETVPPLGTDLTGLMQAQWYIEHFKQVERNLEQARAAFESETEGLATAWVQAADVPAEALARISRGADLIVAGGRPLKETDHYRNAEPAEVMLRAGRPVLVVPPMGGELRAEAVVVAWKDTREARRALGDAMPFLAAANDVLVLEVCGADDVDNAETRTAAVVAGLQRHKVNAHAQVVVGLDRIVTELNIAAVAIGADLIVAGGYGRSRLGEWLFGGVTRDLLQAPERFVLLSH